MTKSHTVDQAWRTLELGAAVAGVERGELLLQLLGEGLERLTPAERDRFRDALEEVAVLPILLAEGHELGDAPIEARFRQRMNELARELDRRFNGAAKGPDRETGFVLLCFPFGDPAGRCNFISNGADRRDIVTLFREMIARFEGQPELRGSA